MESTQGLNRTGSGMTGGRPMPGMGMGAGGDENMEIKAQREDIDSIEQLDQSNRQQRSEMQQSMSREDRSDSEPMDILVQREDIDDNLKDRTDIPRKSQSDMRQSMGGGQQSSSGGQSTSGSMYGSAEMNKFRADLDDFISRIPGMSGMDLNAAKEKLLSSLTSSRETAMQYASEARQQLNQKVEATGEYVKEKPLQSVGIAAGVGFLLGLLVSRR